MPPSMLSSEALVIWMLRIAMKAPIIAASTDTHTVALARSGLMAARGRGAVADNVRSDMASPPGNRRRGLRRCDGLLEGVAVRLRVDRRDHRHARAQFDGRGVEHDLHGDALHHLGEIAGGVV